MRATANGHSDIVKLLLEAGADTEMMEDVRSMLYDTRLPYARKRALYLQDYCCLYFSFWLFLLFCSNQYMSLHL